MTLKCFTYTLNERNEGPGSYLPSSSLAGLTSGNSYYGAALIDNLNNLTGFNAVEITPLQFNQAFPFGPTQTTDPEGNTITVNISPALSGMESSIRQHYAQKMAAVAAPYTPEERETWFAQVAEANAYQANNTASTPLLSAISAVRGVAVATLANTVITKDNAFRSAVGAILGEQQALIDTIWKTS